MSENFKPLVSVIIPTFNRPKYFKLALESALNQTYRNIEVVVFDNSTNDETENLIQSYLSDDSRIKYFRHKNFNANDNWKSARSYNNPAAEYVNWLMDDDLFYPRKLEVMVDIYQCNPDISLVTSKFSHIDENGKPAKDTFFYEHQTNNPLDTLNSVLKITGESAGNTLLTVGDYIDGLTNVLIRKKFLRNNDLCYFDDEKGFYPLADISTWLQLLSQGLMCCIIEPLSAIRLHSARATHLEGNGAIIAMGRAKLIKYCWDKKLFLKAQTDLRLAIFNWISITAMVFLEAQEQDYHGEEIAALEELNIAMAEALHRGCNITLPPSVRRILKKFR